MSEKVVKLLQKYRSVVKEIGVECNVSDEDIICMALMNETLSIIEVRDMRRSEIEKRGRIIKLMD